VLATATYPPPLSHAGRDSTLNISTSVDARPPPRLAFVWRSGRSSKFRGTIQWIDPSESQHAAMHSILIPVSLSLGAAALLVGRRMPLIYIAYVVTGLLYFPARVGFRLQPSGCQLELNAELAALSLKNFPHIIHFAFFFVVTVSQFRDKAMRALLLSGVVTVFMGALVEVAEGVTGKGNCRLRDLVPDTAGILLVALPIVLLWNRTLAGVRRSD
jgi:hypothetical protein